MKKILLITLAAITLAACSNSYMSYHINEVPKNNNKPVLYYTIPQTEVVFEVKLNKITRQKGVFSNQSNLLGLKNVITSDEVKYTVKDIKISSKSVEDPNNQYALLLNDKNLIVEKSEIGTLEAIKYNKVRRHSRVIAKEIRNLIPTLELNKECQEAQKQIIQTQSLPTKPIFEARLQEKGMLEKLNITAEEAVKKIEQLREKQIEILSGSVDGTYMNTTVDFMYKQLDEIIDGYVALFTGTETITEETYYYTLIPQKPIIAEEDLILKLTDSPLPLLARFHTRNSSEKILMSQTDLNLKKAETKPLSDSTISLTLKDSKEKPKGLKGIFTSIPERVEVSVETPNKTYKNTLEIVQYGIINSFNIQNRNIKFDPNTGAIKNILGR